MKALVYHGPGEKAWESVPDPSISEPTDAIVRIDTSTICGTDLHILKGDTPEVKPGTILGHEAVGTVVEIGSAVTTIAVGDRVLVSCVSSCGRCRFCKEGHYGICSGGGGWIFGYMIDGLQAEFARVPFADTSVYKVPPELSDEQVLFLADILPTAYEVGVLNGRVEPGDTVAIVGAGPIGLAAIMTAKLHTPGRIVAIDLADSRLDEGARVRRRRRDQQRQRGRRREGDGADRRARRRRRDRGGRRARHVRALHRADPARRTRRERRRARQVRHAAPREALDPRRDDHDRHRRHAHDADAAQADRGRPARPDRVRDPPLPALPTPWRPTTSSPPPPRRTRSRSCSRQSPSSREEPDNDGVRARDTRARLSSARPKATDPSRARPRRLGRHATTERNTMRKAFQLGGLAAGAILIVFGIVIGSAILTIGGALRRPEITATSSQPSAARLPQARRPRAHDLTPALELAPHVMGSLSRGPRSPPRAAHVRGPGGEVSIGLGYGARSGGASKPATSGGSTPNRPADGSSPSALAPVSGTPYSSLAADSSSAPERGEARPRYSPRGTGRQPTSVIRP